MKRRTIIFLLVVALAIGTCTLTGSAYAMPPVETLSESAPPIDVNRVARSASVQAKFEVPLTYIFFSEKYVPPKEKAAKTLSEEDAQKLARDIVADMFEEKFERHMAFLTGFEKWGYEPKSRDRIPLLALCPSGVKVPDKILTVWKTEKKNIDPDKLEHQQDVKTISETLNVSLSMAKGLVNKLDTVGYMLTKEELDTTSEVELIWYDDGWSDQYPRTLDWEVTVHGSEKNIIKGYENGFILTGTIPEGKLAHIKAGYMDIKEKFKAAPDPVIQSQKKTIERLQKQLDSKKKKYEYKKRSIANATYGDLLRGVVKIRTFYYSTAASGSFIGNMVVGDSSKPVNGFMSSWGGMNLQHTERNNRALVLTNAHVAQIGLRGDGIHVSEDMEYMWWIGAGRPSIRYTTESDLYGTPAHLLIMDGSPVMSISLDTAIMVTTAMPGFQRFKAILGNSDLVRSGDRIISVGNPAGHMKFTTEGRVSNHNHKRSSAIYFDYALRYGMNMARFLQGENASMWFETTIGVGGVSGSGVWASDGPNRGKIIALRNSGLNMLVGMAPVSTDSEPITFATFGFSEYSDEVGHLIKDTIHKYRDRLFRKPFRECRVAYLPKDIDHDFPHFKEAWASRFGYTFADVNQVNGYASIAGMNAGIPINKVKMFLQERGLDPEHFGWDGLDGSYFAK